MECEECRITLWQAGEEAPAGRYIRVDDRSYRIVILDQTGRLPPAFDGHIALYQQASILSSRLRRTQSDASLSESQLEPGQG